MTDWFTAACEIVRPPQPDEIEEGFQRLFVSLDRQASELAKLADGLAALTNSDDRADVGDGG